MRLFISEKELRDQIDVSQKTLQRFIERGDLPNFSYGQGGRKRGWFINELNQFFESKRIKNPRCVGKVRGDNMRVVSLGGDNGAMSEKVTDLNNRHASQKQLGCKKVSQNMGTSRQRGIAKMCADAIVQTATG